MRESALASSACRPVREKFLLFKPLCVLSRLSRVQLFVTPWTVVCQAPPSMGFSGQEYWSGLPCPPPGDLTDPGIEPESPALAGGFFTAEPPGTVPLIPLVCGILLQQPKHTKLVHRSLWAHPLPWQYKIPISSPNDHPSQENSQLPWLLFLSLNCRHIWAVFLFRMF